MGFSNIVILALQTRAFGAFSNDSESELEQQSDKESRLSLKIISLFNTGSNLVRDHSNVINVIFDPNFDPNRVLELTEKVRTEMGVIMNSLMRVPLEL